MQIYQVHTIKKSFFSRKKMNNDSFWQKGKALTSFILPWDKDNPPSTIFRALHDTKNFFFRFDVIDTDIHVNKETNDKMAVLSSDRVEIFFRSDRGMKLYYGLEMDPSGRVMDYKAEYYRKFDYNWKWEGITIRSKYTLNGYRVWGSIPLVSLRNMKLLSDNKIQAGLFRGRCINASPDEPVFKWISWVKPDSETPDFHIPSAFGELKLQ
jgi:hypothetical protein